MLRKEFRSVFRDPRMRMVILGLPVLQTLIFGYAVTLDVRHVRMVLLDRDNTPASRAVVARFTGSGYFDVVLHTNDEVAAGAAIDAARAAAILQINAGFEENLHAGQTALAQLIVDGSDSNTARFVLNYSGIIASAFNQDIVVATALAVWSGWDYFAAFLSDEGNPEA